MNEMGTAEGLKASRDDLDLMFQTWPDNFASLFDMGLRAFERLFNYRIHLKSFFSIQEDDDEGWRKDERIKRIVLSLEQTLADAVATFADPNPDPSDTPSSFLDTLQEIGGLHRAIVPNISPDNFELLFKLLPEVIADVISSRRKEGPLSSVDRQRLLNIWTSVSLLMSRHFVLGWERRIVPKTPKFSKAYSRKKNSTASLNGGQPVVSNPPQTAATTSTTTATATTVTSSNGPPAQPALVEVEERRVAPLQRVIAPITAVRKMK